MLADILHSSKECLHKSAAPHKQQMILLDMFLRISTSDVGKECCAGLQRKQALVPTTYQGPGGCPICVRRPIALLAGTQLLTKL
jgi:hypothetical protein